MMSCEVIKVMDCSAFNMLYDTGLYMNLTLRD